MKREEITALLFVRQDDPHIKQYEIDLNPKIDRQIIEEVSFSSRTNIILKQI